MVIWILQKYFQNKYITCNKNQALKIFQVPNWEWCKHIASVIIPVICNLLVFVGMWFSLPSLTTLIYTTHLLSKDTNESV
jgi:hypothetical protein